MEALEIVEAVLSAVEKIAKTAIGDNIKKNELDYLTSSNALPPEEEKVAQSEKIFIKLEGQKNASQKSTTTHRRKKADKRKRLDRLF